MKIIKFRADNVKRLTAVEITPDGNMVQITGKNGQGKTSVLDAIWWALGGKENIQGQPIRKGAKSARIKLTLGTNEPELLVERRFTEKGDYLFVRNADGARRDKPQEILDNLVGAMTLDPLGFMRAKPAEQFTVLRGLVNLDVNLDTLDAQRVAHFTDRTDVTRRAKQAQARADAITVPDDLPEQEPDIREITDRLTLAAERTAEIARMQRQEQDALAACNAAEDVVIRAKDALTAANAALIDAANLARGISARVLPPPIEAAAVRAELDAANLTRDGIAKRQSKIDAIGEAATLKAEGEALTAAIDKIDLDKQGAMARAQMPIPGLTFGDGVVIYNGLPLDQASDAEQLRISTAIAAANNPKLRIIRIRDGSLLDDDAMKALAEFAETNDFQIWLEKVDGSGEIGIVMEDGHVKGQELEPEDDATASEPEKGAEQQPVEPVEPTGEAATKASTYLDQQLAALTEARHRMDIEKLHAGIKVRLARFPNLVATKWTPAYLAKLKGLKE